MTERQKVFCELYAANPDATAAAIGAGYSRRTARSIGAENLTKPDIMDYIKDLTQPGIDARISTMEEIQEFWTLIMRDDSLPVRERLKASELLGKAFGAFLHVKDTDDVTSGEYDGTDVIFYIPENNRPVLTDDMDAAEE